MGSRLSGAVLLLAIAGTGMACNNDPQPTPAATPSAAGTAAPADAGAKPPPGGAPSAAGTAAPADGKIPAGGPMPAATPSAPPVAATGGPQTINGELAQGDATLNTGEFMDTYSIQLQPGQMVTADVVSTSALDPYVIIRSPGGQQADNDDFNGDRRRAQAQYRADTPGAYTVVVTSYQSGETGSYTLTMTTN